MNKTEKMEALFEKLRIDDPSVLEELSSFAHENPDYPDPWAHLAWNLHYKGYVEEAYQASSHLLTLLTDTSEAYQLHARICFRLGLIDECIQSMKQAITHANDSFSYRRELIETYLHLGKPLPALFDYIRLRLDKSSRKMLPRKLLLRVVADLSARGLSKLLLFNTLRDTVFNWFYFYFARRNKWGYALVFAKSASEGNSTNPLWPERAADAIYNKRDILIPDYDNEIAWRNIALRLDAPYASEKLARIHLHAGHPHTAISVLEKNPPNSVEGCEILAHSLAAKNCYYEAEAIYEKMGELDPIHYTNAAIMRIHTGDFHQATNHCKMALNFNPRQPLAAFIKAASEHLSKNETCNAQTLDNILQELAQKHNWRNRISQIRHDWQSQMTKLLRTGRNQMIHCPICSSQQFLPTYLDPVPDWIRGQCEKCKFLYANPQPLPETISELYLNDSAQSSNLQMFFRKSLGEVLAQPPEEAGRIFGFKERMWEPEFSLPLFEKERGPERKMLDIGCSVGTTMYQYRCRGWEVSGIDLDENAVELARSIDLDVRISTIEDADFPPESFDFITMMDIIEHVSDPKPVFKKVYELLKPGGMLKIKTPCAESIIHYQYGPQWISSDTHLIYFSRNILLECLRRYGFSIVATRSYLEANKITHTYNEWRRLSITPSFDQLVIDWDIGDTITVLARKK